MTAATTASDGSGNRRAPVQVTGAGRQLLPTSSPDDTGPTIGAGTALCSTRYATLYNYLDACYSRMGPTRCHKFTHWCSVATTMSAPHFNKSLLTTEL